MKIKLLLGAVSVLLITGCWQKSVYPFYTEADLVAEPKVIGTWAEPKDRQNPEKAPTSWKFSDAGNKSYLLEIVDSDKKSYLFDARFFKLESNHFLNLSSRQRSISEVPAHHLLKVESIDPFHVRALNIEWMHDWLSKNPKSIRHIKNPDPEKPSDPDQVDYVLTAETKDLQKFILDHLKDDKFFSDGEKMEKQGAK